MSSKQVAADVQIQAAEQRHSYYAIEAKSPVSDEKLADIVHQSVKHIPTSFNNQCTAAVLVLGDKHQLLWDSTKKSIQDKFGADNEGTNGAYVGVIESHCKKAYGTVLYFIDTDVIETNEANPNFGLFKGQFIVWAEHSSAMLQYLVWSALTGEGLGATLQHHPTYAQETNDVITELAGVPKKWKCTALMPFGTPTGPPGGSRPRTYDRLDTRFRVVQ